MHQVVRIHAGDQTGRCLREPVIQRRNQAWPVCPEESKTLVLAGDLREPLVRTVGGMVIDGDDLERCQGLGAHRI